MIRSKKELQLSRAMMRMGWMFVGNPKTSTAPFECLKFAAGFWGLTLEESMASIYTRFDNNDSTSQAPMSAAVKLKNKPACGGDEALKK